MVDFVEEDLKEITKPRNYFWMNDTKNYKKVRNRKFNKVRKIVD